MIQRIRKPKKEDNLSRKFSSEKTVAETLTGDFTIENSRSISIIEEMFNEKYEKICRHNLVKLAKEISKKINVTFQRNYGRRKILVIKYFDENLEKIIPIMPMMLMKFDD